jgi:hypothetical protein
VVFGRGGIHRGGNPIGIGSSGLGVWPAIAIADAPTEGHGPFLRIFTVHCPLSTVHRPLSTTTPGCSIPSAWR